MRRRRRHPRHQGPQELNITAFMNLMVILVPFLLITAVFSRMAILELNLPGDGSAVTENDDQAFDLEVTVRPARLEVGDRTTGLLKVIENGEDGYDFAGLSAYLREVKLQFPDKLDATVLLEPEIAYDTVVQVMDTVRVAPLEEGSSAYGELFPDIAIGDAVMGEELAAVGGGG